MISRLCGVILEKKPPFLLIDVHGVGYEVSAPMSTFYHLPEVGQTVVILTHFVVREDAQLLYGFYKSEERELFRALIKVNGVGPKLALAILSGMDPDQFAHCVLEGDSASLVKLPGVGKKTAERLVVEMRDRLADWHVDASVSSAGSTVTASSGSIKQEAISALTALGYKPHDATRMVKKVEGECDSSEELIRAALKETVS